ncbi:AtpZ/AtpI family protein [Chloroflexota bacterium]
MVYWYLHVLGVMGGLWLDNKFNTRPILVIVGLILGIIVAFYGTYRVVISNINNKQDEEQG